MAAFSFAEYFERVRKNNLPRVALFHGEEDFLADQLIQAIVGKAVDASVLSFNYDTFDGGKVDLRDVLSVASSYPMMSEKRVVVVRDVEKLATGNAAVDRFVDHLRRPVESTVLLLTTDKLDKRFRIFKALEESAEVVACAPLYDNQVPDWIAKRIKKAGKSADDDACRLLHEYVGRNLRSIEQEIRKLFVSVGDSPTITIEDVATVAGLSRGFTVFDLQDAIGTRDLTAATRILRRMVEMGESPVFIVSMLARFMLNLWKIIELKRQGATESEVLSRFRLKPSAVKKLAAHASRFTVADMESSILAIDRTDRSLKTSAMDPSVALDLLLYSLIRGKEKAVDLELMQE